MRDSLHNHSYAAMIKPIVVSDNSPQVGGWLAVDRYESLTFGIMTGTLADADATFMVLVEDADADDQSDAAPVADTWLISQVDGAAPEAAASFDHTNTTVRRIGYVGHKKYVRVTITPANNSSAAALACFAVRGNPHFRPLA